MRKLKSYRKKKLKKKNSTFNSNNHSQERKQGMLYFPLDNKFELF